VKDTAGSQPFDHVLSIACDAELIRRVDAHVARLRQLRPVERVSRSLALRLIVDEALRRAENAP